MRLFEKAGDYQAFERVLEETLQEVPMRICAFCAMPSHWHMLCWPERDGDLATSSSGLASPHLLLSGNGGGGGSRTGCSASSFLMTSIPRSS